MSALGLGTLTQAQLDTWVVEARAQTRRGRLPSYIPLLATANPEWFAVRIQTVNGQSYRSGDISLSLPLMSVIKPFMLLFLLERLGAATIFSHVGMQPSIAPFNSLAQLQADNGWPRNPMINSGAIVLASLLPGRDALERTLGLCEWLNQSAGCQLFLDRLMLNSVLSVPNESNRGIVELLEQVGRLPVAETALETYNHVCCLSGTIADLAALGMLLVQPNDLIAIEHRRTVQALMITCGLYQASATFAVQVGLPSKSGVSGALLSVVPRSGAIACYSPPLDPMGNSQASLFLLQQLTRSLDLNIFG